MLARELNSSFNSLSSNLRSSPSSCSAPLPVSEVLQRPVKRTFNPAKPSNVYILAKLNYKFYANISEPSKNTRCFSAILEIGAGSIFIRVGELPPRLFKRIKQFDGSLIMRIASRKTVPITGTILLVVLIVTRMLRFLVPKELAN